jgi:hypothetical protein
MVNYVPRRLWDNLSFALARTPCAEVRRLGVDCSHPLAATGGGNCKCNSWLSVAASRLVRMRLRYHRYAVEVVRTPKAAELIADARRRFGADGMRPLHNRSRAPSDLRHVVRSGRSGET